MTVDLSKVVPVDSLAGSPELWNDDLNQMFGEASRYLMSFAWVSRVREAYFGLGVAGVVAVFLFRIDPASEAADEWIWVVVGDLPPAYLVTENAPNAASALDAYIGEMEKWVDAASSGRPVDDFIPVNVPPTPANAEELRRRLRQLDEDILTEYADDLESGCS